MARRCCTSFISKFGRLRALGTCVAADSLFKLKHYGNVTMEALRPLVAR